jgi:hypothetical protein
MFTKLKGLHKKYKKYLTVNTMVLTILFFLIPYVGYLHYKINYTGMIQYKMYKYLETNASEQDQEKIRTHAIAIQQKISDYEPVGNEHVDQYVLTAYQSAKELALKADDSCYVVERMGDDVLEAYKLGKVEGNRMWNNLPNNF